MFKSAFLILLAVSPILSFGKDTNSDTLTIKPIGVDYSRYPGNHKLYIVGECDGMNGNQIVVFQNRPSFAFFESNETYTEEQKELEKAIWQMIHDNETMQVQGKWHTYNNRMIFLCHRILKMKKAVPVN